jgi:hypothetical protein
MADKDITIGIKTTGADTAAADIRKVEDATEDLGRAQRQAQYDAGKAGGMGGQLAPGVSLPSRDMEAANAAATRSFAELKDKVRVTEIAYYDLNAEIARTGNTIESVAAGPITTAGKKLQAAAPPLKNLGGVFTNVGYQVTDFTTQVSMGTSAFTAFAQQAPQAIGAIQAMGGAGVKLSEALSTSVGAMLPLSLIVTELAIGIPMAVRAWESMTAAQKKLADSSKNAAEQLAFQRSQQQLLTEQEARGFVAGYYAEQAEELERQVRAIERINQLRGELNNIEQQRANQEITIAGQRGGDVALAEANALAVQLRTGVEALNGTLGEAQQKASVAQAAAEAASSAYQTAINTNATAKEIEDLGALKTKAETAAAEARQAFADTTQKITAQRAALLSDVEIDLADKEAEYSDKTSAAAAKGFQSVYDSLKEAVATGPTAAIEQIKVEVGTITTAATAKVTEVKTSLDTERRDTVSAIKSATPTPQDTQAIVDSIRALSEAINNQGNAMISTINAITAVVNENARRMGNFQQQINQIMARIR